MRHLAIVIAVALVSAGCDRTPAEGPAPPDGSYAATTHQLTAGEATVPLTGAAVSPAFFTALGTAPLLGRPFSAADYQPAGMPVVMLSHGLWSERFAARPDIIGQQIDLDGQAVLVVGVMPRGFAQPDGAQLWTPRPGEAGR